MVRFCHQSQNKSFTNIPKYNQQDLDMLFVHLRCHARMAVAVTLENGQQICCPSKTKQIEQTDGSTSR